MNEVVQTTFRNTVRFLRSEVKVMPLSRWNESVLRYFFCRFLAMHYPEVEQFVECDKIDLVLRRVSESAFIEFEFYRHPRRFDPYDGRARGYKGGPGRKNLREFQACINYLRDRPSAPNLSKYILLVYADPTDGSRPGLRFAHHYDDYHHTRRDLGLQLVDAAGPIRTAGVIVHAQLYGIAEASRP